MFQNLFQKKNKELEQLLLVLSNDASNNYKDAAQLDFKRLKELYERLSFDQKLSERQKVYYGEQIKDWEKQLDKFTHKDQKASW